MNGAVGGGFWTARVTGGTQDYFQTFSAIAADRRTERLTNDQTIPGSFFTVSGQWMPHVEKDRSAGRCRSARHLRRHRRGPLRGQRHADRGADAERGRAERLRLRPHPLRAARRSVGRPWRARRSVEIHRVDRLLQSTSDRDLESRRGCVVPVLGVPRLPHADAQRAVSRLPGRQHRDQCECPAASRRTSPASKVAS